MSPTIRRCRAAAPRCPWSPPWPMPAGPVTVVIDSTGLKVFGAGEWRMAKHGGRDRRTWRKLHLAIDPDTGEGLLSRQR